MNGKFKFRAKELIILEVIGFIIFGILSASKPKVTQKETIDLTGAWKLVKSSGTSQPAPNVVKIMVDGYFTFAEYDGTNKKFIGAGGGLYTLDKNVVTEKFEYNTKDSSITGTTKSYPVKLSGSSFVITRSENNKKIEETWQRVDDGKTGLVGAWRIRERESEPGKMSVMQRGPRKTIKYLSGTRFQWAAINTETNQFFGTGGGTYSLKEGKYTENIEFFSRDAQRVGMSISFDYELKNGDWHHRGLSTTGNKIYEIWAKEK